MARRRNDDVREEGTAQSIVSTTIGAAEALSVGVLHLTERTLLEALRAVEDIGGELGSAVVRATRGSIKAAEDIGTDLVQVGRDVTSGVAEPARQIGDGVARLARGFWTGEARVRKAPAKASGRRRRRRSAA
jgi:hypothetical protein